MRKTHNGSPGLFTAPNSELSPPGALKQALGTVVKRPGLLEKARSYKQYAAKAESAGMPTTFGLIYYGSRFFQLAQTALKIWKETGSGTGVFAATTYPTVVSDAITSTGISTLPYDGNVYWPKSAEQSGNLYLATGLGALKFDAATSNPALAGIHRALDVQLTLVASGSLLANTNSVGYRVVFGVQDANKNLILGPPSGRATVTATAAQNVTVKTWIPVTIYNAASPTSYFYQVYRTAVSTISGVDPGEEMQLVYQAYLTSTDVSNRYVSFTDALPDAIRGAALYTSPSQEGIAAANHPPPISADIASFKGTMFYANCVGKHRARVQMLGTAPVYTISTAAGGITKSGGSGIVTLTGSPDLTSIPTDGSAYISISGATTAANNGDFPITGVVAATSITYTNAAAVTEAGAAGARCVATKLTIAGSNYYASLIAENTSSPYRYLVTTSGGVGTTSTNVDAASKSLLRVVNQTNSAWYGYYESGPDDGAGKMLFEEKIYGGGGLTISGAGLVFANCFAPAIQTASPITSSNDIALNRIYYSKPGQPEHVPLANYYDIGSRAASILRIVPLREAILVFKQDGLYRITGDGATWTVNLVDATLQAFNVANYAQPVTVCGNRAYVVTQRGVFEVTESTVRCVSDNIADVVRKYIDQYNANAYVSMTASDVDHLVTLYVAYDQTSNVNSYRLNVDTGAWTEDYGYGTIEGNSNVAMLALPGCQVNGLMYRTNSGDIYAEDKYSFSESAYFGNNGSPVPASKYLINITAVNAGASTITATSYAFTPVLGTVIRDNGGTGVFQVTNVAGTTYTLTALYGAFAFTTGHAYVYVPNRSVVEWVPYTAGDDSALKRFREVTILLDGASTLTTATVQMYTEATTATTVAAFTSTNSPTPSGISTLTALRCLVPLNMQQARRLSVIFTHNTVGEFVFVRGIAYEFDVLSDANAVT